MKAFMMRLDRGKINCECYVQQITGREEDIFIVNLRDSGLIRQQRCSKVVIYLKKQESKDGAATALQLQEHLWESLHNEEKIQQ
jgi:hypothetical protein